ncbi:glycosyltransferase family 2 protein [Bifidobacterium jacchi]|nr:glycosyltransferase family 2 protein [Bifidobacterium jacchi]
MPTYNRAGLIGRSIDSILLQDYTNFELIIVDDGSTDNTKEIVREFADPRIRYVYQKNQGACVARNLGVSIAKGNIIAFQDSDDVWLPGKLSVQLSNMAANGSDIDICQMRTISATGETLNMKPSNKLVRKGLNYPTILEANFISTQMIVAKKSVLTENKFDSLMPRFQDWDLAIRLLKRGNKLSYSKKVLVEQYISSDSISLNGEKAYCGYSILEKKYKTDLQQNRKEYANFLYYKFRVCGDSLSLGERRDLLKTSIKYFPNIRNILWYCKLLAED